MLVREVLDVSTGHLTEDTKAALEAGAVDGVKAVSTGDGWFMRVPSSLEGLPPDLGGVLQAARGAGCDFILVEWDAPEVDGLRIHEEAAEE